MANGDVTIVLSRLFAPFARPSRKAEQRSARAATSGHFAAHCVRRLAPEVATRRRLVRRRRAPPSISWRDALLRTSCLESRDASRVSRFRVFRIASHDFAHSLACSPCSAMGHKDARIVGYDAPMNTSRCSADGAARTSQHALFGAVAFRQCRDRGRPKHIPSLT